MSGNPGDDHGRNHYSHRDAEASEHDPVGQADVTAFKRDSHATTGVFPLNESNQF
jgi:hypothetical protein